MKRTIFAGILLFLITASAFAQEGVSNVGLNVGFVQPVERYRASANADKLTTRVTNGFKVGLAYESTFIKGFGVSMSLNYGFSADVNKYEAIPGMTLRQTKEDHFYHFLELPVDWQYKFTIAKQTYLTLYTGPTLQVGLSNRFEKYEKVGDLVARTTTDVYKIDSDNDGIRDYNRVYVTWGVGLGLQYKRYFIRGGYDFGIMPMYKDPFFNITETEGWYHKGRLDQWQIKLGIYFWEIR